MQPSFDGEHILFRSHARNVCLLAGCAWALSLAGCGHQAKKDNPTATATTRQSVAAAEDASSPPIEGRPASGIDQVPAAAEKKAAATAGAADPVDDAVRKPATVAEAEQVLDLQTFPRLEGADEGGSRTMAHLSYQAPGEVKKLMNSSANTSPSGNGKNCPNRR